ncbi:NAD(P)/FAD-dependent oxidoreductase [Acidobacteriota bacterium]
MSKKICVVGGGISGLSAAYFALKRGYAVELYESSDILGGLAASFSFGPIDIEKFYHFICGGDKKLISLAGELSIQDRLRFRPTKTAYYYNGKYFPFSTPVDLLRFTPISFLSRLRFGFHTAYSKVNTKWHHLDEIPAKEWLVRSIGEQAYQVLWHTLLMEKFGDFHDQISASWIWHRIHRVASSRKGIFAKEQMGYFEGGSQTLIDTIHKKITEMGGMIHLNQKVDAIKKSDNRLCVQTDTSTSNPFDRVVLAIPSPIAARLIGNMDATFSKQLSAIHFFGVICGIFRLQEKISDAFWLNINDPNISANGLIEYTNLNPLKSISPHKIIYMPIYLPEDDRRFSEKDSVLKSEFFASLKKLKPSLHDESIVDFRIFKAPYAQPICTVPFKDKIPPVKTPAEEVYLLDSTQVYPSDRSLNAMITLAEDMVKQHFPAQN